MFIVHYREYGIDNLYGKSFGPFNTLEEAKIWMKNDVNSKQSNGLIYKLDNGLSYNMLGYGHWEINEIIKI